MKRKEKMQKNFIQALVQKISWRLFGLSASFYFNLYPLSSFFIMSPVTLARKEEAKILIGFESGFSLRPLNLFLKGFQSPQNFRQILKRSQSAHLVPASF